MSPRPWQSLATLLLATVGVTTATTPAKTPKKPVIPEAYLANAIPPGEAFVQDAHYNEGAYGLYINRTFKSSPVVGPRIGFDHPFTECDDGSHLFITPRGEIVSPSPVILDAEGSLVWTPGSNYGQVYNFQVQEYKGEQYLTFWGGDNSVGGHGEGTYYMFDKHYQSYRNISSSNGLAADLHSFTILPGGTALMSAYQKVQIPYPTQLSRKKPKNGRLWIWESLFQEFDLETGQVVFEWRASDHFDYDESYTSLNEKKKYGWAQDAWDWFHLNMIEKDALGNYLISARHLRTVAYVSGETGEVLWRLGGKKNNFTDLSGGHATGFVGQHDAHWAGSDNRFLTLFDNRADWAFEAEHVSKGTRVELDLVDMTARLDVSYVHPLRIFGFSQGSYQTLPNGNALIGYGYTGAMAEFAPNGTLLCDANFGPSARFSSGDVQSYRNLKFNWTGIPLDPPALVLAVDDQNNNTNSNEQGQSRSLYMSWHGSTETRQWWLQDSHFPDGPFGPVSVFRKTGFETAIPLRGDFPVRKYVRVVALDAAGQELGTSGVLSLGDLATHVHEEEMIAAEAVSQGQAVASVGTDTLAAAAEAEAVAYISEGGSGGNEGMMAAPMDNPPAVVVLALPPEYDDISSDAATAALEDELEDVELMFGIGVLAMVAVILIFYASLMPRWRWPATRSAEAAWVATPGAEVRGKGGVWRLIFASDKRSLYRLLRGTRSEEDMGEALMAEIDRGL